MGRVIVVGSVNQDRVVRCSSLPASGETVVASSSAGGFGGKGGNQSCAAARLGADTVLVGAVGSDAAGTAATRDLREHGVDVSAVAVLAGQPTGVAHVFVDDDGENFVVLEPGANAALEADAVTRCVQGLRLEAGDVVLTSAEIRPEAVAAAGEQARAATALHVHNMAPFHPLGPWATGTHFILVANAVEARQATGEADPFTAAAQLASGRLASMVTLGSGGVVLAAADGLHAFPSPHVSAVDTTGAGDAFCGALAAALAVGRELHSATELAVRAGAFAVTGKGARGALPTMAELP